MEGGALSTSKHRRKKLSGRAHHKPARDSVRESNGDSADCEQSDDSDNETNIVSTAGDAKFNLHASPKSSLNRARNTTWIKSPKTTDQNQTKSSSWRRSLKLETSGSDSSPERSSEHRSSRKTAKPISTANNTKQQLTKPTVRDASSCSDTNRRKSEKVINTTTKTSEARLHSGGRVQESDESQDENKPPAKIKRKEDKSKEKMRREEKAKEEKRKVVYNNAVVSDDNSDMPELEPQVQVIIPKQHKEKVVTTPPSGDKKDKHAEKFKQVSVKEFFQKQAKHNSGHKEKKEVKEGDKVQKQAIENNFGVNQGYLTAFETFIQKDEVVVDRSKPSLDKESKRPNLEQKYESNKIGKRLDVQHTLTKPETVISKPDTKSDSGNAFKLIASTLHPKKVLKEERRKAVERERLAKKMREKESALAEDSKKRKEREWEMSRELLKQEQLEKERQREEREKEKKQLEKERIESERAREFEEAKRRERSDRKKKEKDERRRLEKRERERIMEKEKLKLTEKEHMMMEKRKKNLESRLEPDKQIPTSNQPKSSEHKPLESPRLRITDNPVTLEEPKPRLSDAEGDIKTPKKLRRWLPENESPDPKKNFIKKHQEQLEEQARKSSKEVTPPKEATKEHVQHHHQQHGKERKQSGTKNNKSEEKQENSMWENLGYNSGDDVVKFGDDQLDKNPPLKPSENKTEEEETVSVQTVVVVEKVEPKVPELQPPPVPEPVSEPPPPKVEEEVVEVPEQAAVPVQVVQQPPPPSCMEQEKLQQQQILQTAAQTKPQCSQQQQQQPEQQQQPAPPLSQVPIEQCAVLQEQQRKLVQEQHLPPPPTVQIEHQQQSQLIDQQHQTLEHQQIDPQHQQQQQHMDQQQQQQHGHIDQQQQQQYMTDMSGAYYPTADTGEGGNQFYPGPEKTDHGQSLGVYTPDSSTNSVHSMHGFTGHTGDSGEFHAGPGDTSGEYTTHPAGDNTGEYHGAADTSADYTHSETADAVHNATVMESPNSIGSVEIPQVYDANGMAHHRLPAQGNSPQHVQQQQQMTAAMHSNMNKHSPHHQQTPITSQSPHPLPNQSPHPQPSPHNQQSSPHPQIIPQQNTPYTGLPHMSPTPQPTYAPSRSSQPTSKSPRQQNRAAAQHLSTQQQAAHHAFAAQYIAASQYGEAAMVANIARKHPSNPMYRYDPAFGMFSGTTFPATTGVSHTPPTLGAPHYSGRAGHHMDTHAQQVVSAQAAAFYPNQQHTAGAHPSSLVSLQQLTQRLDLLPPVPQHSKSPPPQPSQRSKTSTSSGKSSRPSAAAVSAATHHGIALPGYGYPGAHSSGAGQRTAAGQRPPNVAINPGLSAMQYNAMQYNAYNAAMLNPALMNQMYPGHYDPQRGGSANMYGYGAPYINYHR